MKHVLVGAPGRGRAAIFAIVLGTSIRAWAAPAPAPSPVADASSPPALAVAVEEARATGRALIVEFSAVWCEPCKVLEAEVLPHPEVRAALRRVLFVRYDVDQPLGRAAADRFRVDGYPTFVAVGQGGDAVDRVTGLRSPPELSLWIRQASAAARPSLEDVLAEVKKRPRDAQLALEAARRHLETERTAEARPLLLTAEREAPRAGELQAEAAFERLRVEVIASEHELRARLAREYLARHPGGPRAVEVAEIYSTAEPPPAESDKRLGPVVAAFVAASAPAPGEKQRKLDPDRRLRLRALVLACLRARAHGAALLASAALDEDAQGLLLRAEVRHQRREKDEAVTLGEQAQKAANGPRERVAVDAALARFRRGGADPGDTLRLSDPLARPGSASAPPPAPPPPPPRDPQQEATIARAAAFRQLVSKVARACEPFAKRGPRRVWVQVDTAGGRRVAAVRLLAPADVPVLLSGCIGFELRGVDFAHPVDGEDTFAIQF